MTTAPTHRTYTSLDAAYDHFNRDAVRRHAAAVPDYHAAAQGGLRVFLGRTLRQRRRSRRRSPTKSP